MSQRISSFWLVLFLSALAMTAVIAWRGSHDNFPRMTRPPYVPKSEPRHFVDYEPPSTPYKPVIERIVLPVTAPDRVTLAAFNRIRAGMTLAEVREIIGFDGKQLAESDLLNTHHEIWSWQNDDGSNMNVQFMDGKSHTKAQFGLR